MDRAKYYGISPHVTFVDIQVPPTANIEFMDPDHVLSYVQSGFVDMMVQGRICHLQVGDMILLPPLANHVVRKVATSAVFYVLTFDFFFSETWSLMPRTQRPMDPEKLDARERGMVDEIRVVRLEPWQQTRMESLFLSLLAKYADKQTDSSLSQKALVIDMLNMYLEGPTRDAVPTSEVYTWRTIEKAMRYIKEHYRNSELSNAEVAQHVGVSTNYMTSLFTKRIGVPMHRYINGLRIGQACYMIREGNFTYSEIAEQVGLTGMQNFCKVFKREIGCTASEFERRCEKA